jgi:hypothetical protein
LPSRQLFCRREQSLKKLASGPLARAVSLPNHVGLKYVVVTGECIGHGIGSMDQCYDKKLFFAKKWSIFHPITVICAEKKSL